MKRRIEPYSFYDHTGIAAHLEDMAARGWMLKSVGAFTWNYEKCEPVKARFAVTYYPRLSEFDPADNPDLASFAEFCARTGWKFVCSKAPAHRHRPGARAREYPRLGEEELYLPLRAAARARPAHGCDVALNAHKRPGEPACERLAAFDGLLLAHAGRALRRGARGLLPLAAARARGRGEGRIPAHARHDRPAALCHMGRRAHAGLLAFEPPVHRQPADAGRGRHDAGRVTRR